MTIGIVAIICLMPFHAFLTVWGASLVGHYMALRLWKEVLLVLLLAGVLLAIRRDPQLRWRLISYKLHWLLAGYLVVQLLWGIIALAAHSVTMKALAYGWVVNLRFLAFFVVTWTAAAYAPRLVHRWPRWLIWPLAVVIGVGLLQYFVLPYDFLRHFGYNDRTIFPYATINHDIHHLRILSTLRGPNPLGAYLLVGLSLVVALWFKQRRWLYVALIVGGLATLYLSFSRGAWIGFVVSLAIIVWFSLTNRRARLMLGAVAVGIVLVAGVLTAALWHNTGFQNAVFHTSDKSTIKISSNDGHESALRSGLHDIIKQPFGRGPGSAGPASVYNDGRGRIAENYFVQIAQETGWIGLLLFIAINLVVGRALWRRRHQTLALGLLASLVGLTIVNLLSHAWTDDTLAYLWWGLAGLAITTDWTKSDAHATAILD